jgi:ABC-type amino acid transport substrate-binding protein
MKKQTYRWLRFACMLLMMARATSHAQVPQAPNESTLRSSRIGVVQGSAHDTYAQKNLPQAQIFQFVSVSDLVLAVETGHVQAGISDEEGLQVLRKEKPQLSPVGA